MSAPLELDRLLGRLQGVKETSGGFIAKCPAHDDKNPSLSIGEGADGRVLLHCHAGCDYGEVTRALGLEKGELSPQKESKVRGKITATYDYSDSKGNLLFQTVRLDPKDFTQRRPDPNKPGEWIWNLKGVQRVLYRLPELTRDLARGLPAFLAEGEKDVEALMAKGFTASCNPLGAKKWRPEYNDVFNGADVIIIADRDAAGREHGELVARSLAGIAERVRVLELPDVNGKPVKDAADFFAAGGDTGQLQDLVDKAPDWTPQPNPIVALLREREFKPDIAPPPLRAVYVLAGIPISTPGNLSTITSAIKTGKSAVIGAMAAAAMPHPDGADLLGFSSSNPKGAGLVWFDSEQSPDDFWHCVNRALRRAGLPKPPPWLHAYCLTGLGCKRAWECITEATQATADQHGGIHSILIDGIADLVADVNSPEESNAFVATLHDMAIQQDCPIVGVIHFNPNSDKSRGHLGSQVERKAETNLALEKDADETTVIYSTKNRRAGICKDRGPRFAYSEEAGMHVSIQSRQSVKDAEKREALLALAEDVFNERPAMRRAELETTVKKLLTVSPKTAERKVTEMLRHTVINKSIGGMYEMTKQANTR